jgi:5-carboxymethyl-2-hydroxymuconate isomerase
MPHCILEYSSNIADSPDARETLGRLHTLIAASFDTRINNIKSRMLQRSDYFVSDGSRDQSFIHLELAAMDGSPPEMIRRLGKKLHDFLKAEFPQTTASSNCSITVEIRDMRSENYFRESVGNI